jgi:IrrE N-terminal-like domain
LPAGQFLEWVERQGRSLRRYLHLTSLAVLDPRELANQLGIGLFSPDDLPELPAQIINQLLVEDPQSWSAGCIELPTGNKVILYNPTHTDARTNASLMEELAHVHLKHKGSKLIVYSGGLALRTYNQQQEK